MILWLGQSEILSDKNAPWLILGFGVFLMIYVVIRPFLRRKTDPMDKPAFSRSLSQQRAVERQMENLLVELSEMTRQMSAQLDTRATKLEMLLNEADAKIALLRQLKQNLESSGTFSRKTDGSENTSPVRSIEPDEMDPIHAQVYTLADEGKTVSQIASTLARPSGEIELILALRQRSRVEDT